MARYRLRKGVRSTVYRPGQFVSRSYAKRYPHLVKRQRTVAPKRRPPPRLRRPPVVRPPREWEVTLVAKTRKGRRERSIDVTFRVVPRRGVEATETSVRKAVWAAAVHGVTLRDYSIRGIDWRWNEAGRKPHEYRYFGAEAEEAAKSTSSLMRRVGMQGLRVAPVEA